jgi:hypothetical protein
MKLQDTVRKLYLDDRRLQFALLAFMVLFYGVILSNARLHHPTWPVDRTFNSMLDHLAHGQFDVDPKIIGMEGSERNGHIYTYFGVTCALVRLPLLLFHRLDLDVTRWSCFFAVCLAGMMKIRIVLFLRRYCGPAPTSEWAFGLMLAYIVLGGAEIGFLKASLFQEALSWAVAFAAVFVYFAVKGLVTGQFTTVTLSWMALAAGFGLHAKISTGLGLCSAFGLLLLVLLVKEIRAGRAVLTLRFFLPVAILAGFLIAAGTINYYRWGNPLAFSGGFYLQFYISPERVTRLHTYGNFNLARLPLGLSYYFLPFWALHGSDGRLFLESTQTRLMDVVELPPCSFFLTDLLPIAFIAFLAIALWAGRHSLARALRAEWGFAQDEQTQPPLRLFSPAQGLALAAGLAVPCVLMLTFINMCYRYRMEFYPEMDLLALLGLYAIVSNPALLARFNRCRRWMLAAAVVSIVSAFMALLLYKVSTLYTAQPLLRNGVVHYYMYDALQNLNHPGH